MHACLCILLPLLCLQTGISSYFERGRVFEMDQSQQSIQQLVSVADYGKSRQSGVLNE